MRTTGKTRDRIMKAAFEEFTEKGYDRTKTRQIAERASVNEVTIFRHFGSKERLFTTVIENGIRNGMIAVARIEPGDDVIEDLTEIGISVARSMMTNARFTKLISDEYHNIHPMLTKVMSDAYFEMVDVICQYLYKAIEKGTIRNINADLAAIMFFSPFLIA